jgi:hypothetical protein
MGLCPEVDWLAGWGELGLSGLSVHLVCFVYLVDLVYLVSFIQPNKRNRPNKPNNGLLPA